MAGSHIQTAMHCTTTQHVHTTLEAWNLKLKHAWPGSPCCEVLADQIEEGLFLAYPGFHKALLQTR